MSRMKTSDLVGPALDWAVAKVEGVETSWRYDCELVKVRDNDGIKLIESIRPVYSPSTNWAQCGPLIEKYSMTVSSGRYGGTALAGNQIDHYSDGPKPYAPVAPTVLIAICRGVIVSSIGNSIAIPDELVKP